MLAQTHRATEEQQSVKDRLVFITLGISLGFLLRERANLIEQCSDLRIVLEESVGEEEKAETLVDVGELVLWELLHMLSEVSLRSLVGCKDLTQGKTKDVSDSSIGEQRFAALLFTIEEQECQLLDR